MGGESATSSAAQPAGAPAPRISNWAVASLLCGIAICCPAMTLLSPLLGLRALVQINADPRIGGRRTAWTGIVIGLLVTAGWAVGFVWWHYHARVRMLEGPGPELRAGAAGNIAAFKAGFHGDGASAPDDQAEAFLEELSRRYGRFVESAQRVAGPSATPAARPAALRIAYRLQFDGGAVDAEALFITFAPARVVPRPVFQWGWLRVIDAHRGDLVYPVSAAPPHIAPLPQAVPPP